MLIATRTLFIRRNELIRDCNSFYYPYQILECKDKIDPCRFTSTETAPKCAYYIIMNRLILLL